MKSRSFTASAFVRLPALAMTLCLAGCPSIQPTLTSGTTEAAIAADVCSEWVGIPYKRTDWNQINVRANNAARDAYCRGAEE